MKFPILCLGKAGWKGIFHRNDQVSLSAPLLHLGELMRLLKLSPKQLLALGAHSPKSLEAQAMFAKSASGDPYFFDFFFPFVSPKLACDSAMTFISRAEFRVLCRALHIATYVTGCFLWSVDS